MEFTNYMLEIGKNWLSIQIIMHAAACNWDLSQKIRLRNSVVDQYHLFFWYTIGMEPLRTYGLG